MNTEYLLSIGVNTGNSLDAADAVLTKFGSDGSITDLDAISVSMPEELANKLRAFRSVVVESAGDMQAAIKLYDKQAEPNQQSANNLITEYTHYVAAAIKELLKRPAANGLHIDVVGVHGQTCAHQPPSIAKQPGTAYTVQIGDGQLLANEIGITVVYDFRSDDLMNGGEAAPLAPIHHQHLAKHLKNKGKFPIAFCNAGNTGNISVITENKEKNIKVLGWDVGPFNDYPDKLMQAEQNKLCDLDGLIGAQGKINQDLLRLLFEKGAVTDHGANYLLQAPPKSSDPQWYRILPELSGKSAVNGQILPFADRIKTAEYFAAYVYYYSLKWIPDELTIPTRYALCGGGWNNPISRNGFEQLLRGNFEQSPVLSEHKELFMQISNRLKKAGTIEIDMADKFGFSGQYMEARLFADAAVCRITGEPFSLPATSGCKTPTVLGTIRFPNGKKENASENLKKWLTKHKSIGLTLDDPKIFDGRWSRATAGWDNRRTSITRRKPD